MSESMLRPILKMLKKKSLFIFMILASVIFCLTCISTDRTNLSTDLHISHPIQSKENGIYTDVNNISSTEKEILGTSTILRPHDVFKEIEHYCNSPLKPVTGSEGDAIEGFNLRMVHVLLRHGDRMSFVSSGNRISKSEDCLVGTSLMENDGTFKTFVQAMAKFTEAHSHGNYFQNWDLFPNKSFCPEASLTGVGAIQHLRLGQYLRDKYLTQSSIFDNETALTSQITTYSSETTRTYQSAIAFLFGFLTLSDFNLNCLNISRSDGYFCPLELPKDKNCNCQYGKILANKFGNLRKTYFVSSMKNNKNILTPFQDYNFGRVSPFIALMDVIYVAVCHGRSNLCLTDNNAACLNREQIKQIWEKFNDETGYVVEHIKNSKYFYNALYPLMADIANRFKDHIKERSQQRLIVYSSHDTALMSLLYMLEIDASWIRYAGRIILELYESESESHNDTDKHYIRILLNGQDVTQNVKFCKGRTFKGLCNFTFFNDFVFNEMLQQFGYTRYYEVCSRLT